MKAAAGVEMHLLVGVLGTWNHAEGISSPELVFDASEQPVTVRVRAVDAGAATVEACRYSLELELEPGPESEVALFGRGLEEGLALQGEWVAAQNARKHRSEALVTGRAQIEARRASLCPTSNAVYAAIQERDSLAYRFCDGSVVRTGGGKTTLLRALGGDDYDQFVSREKSVLQVAEHNASVLRTAEWGGRAADARAAFEARVRLFVTKFRKSEGWYFAEAKRSNVPVIGD